MAWRQTSTEYNRCTWSQATCKDTRIAESIITWLLLSEFDELKITRRTIHKFAGMVFDFPTPKKLKITMKKGLEDILNRNVITGTAGTPSTLELFHIDPDSPRLDEDISERFHSEVASISYAVKKTDKTRILNCHITSNSDDPGALQHRTRLEIAPTPTKLSCGNQKHPSDSRNGWRPDRNRR